MKNLSITTVVLIAVLLLVACSGSSNPTPEPNPKPVRIIVGETSELPEGITLELEYEMDGDRIDNISAVVTNVSEGNVVVRDNVYGFNVKDNGEWVTVPHNARWLSADHAWGMPHGQSFEFSVHTLEFYEDGSQSLDLILNTIYVPEFEPGIYRIGTNITVIEPIWHGDVWIEFTIEG